MKPLCVIQGPFATRSGYGDMARDIVRHFIELDLYEVVLVSMGWGGCPVTALDPVRDAEIIKRIAPQPVQLPRQPEVFVQIAVPSEFHPIGKVNIGITAGIETTMCSAEWVEGCNRMDTVWTISQHSKNVFDMTRLEQRGPNGQVIREFKVQKPVEVLHNCIHTDVFRKLNGDEVPGTVKEFMETVTENFCFLFVGHWIIGHGHDRKNVAMLINEFCETFKMVGAANRPALILKVSGASFSVMDREEMLARIENIKQRHGPHAPNIYLLHGDLTEEEMNGLYNHPKVKVHISLTRGEGFGRPLLEATQSGKPVICSGWSGVVDFLNPVEAVLVGGKLKQVEPEAVWQGVIIPEAQWFAPDPQQVKQAMRQVHKNYDRFIPGARALAKKNQEAFSYDAIKQRTKELIDRYVPKFATEVPMQLPKLSKLPTLKKIGAE